MKRRKFIKQSAKLGLAVGMSGTIACKEKLVITKNLPTNWLWIRPDIELSLEVWTEKLKELKVLGFDAILPQVYSGNKTLFNLPDHDMTMPWLEKIIPLAHQEGLEVHAWMWTMPCIDERILTNHPDWYVVNRLGEPADTHPAYVNYYKFLCPRKEEVKSFIKERVKALAAIPDLDGIHLDYVRMPDVILAEALQPKYGIVQDQEYPAYDYCYCETCRRAYQERTGVDPMTIQDPANDKDWYQFRYDAVVDLVNNYLVPAAKAKSKTITAAVFPNWESVRQQWHHFDLDAFLPMLYQGFYNKDVAWIGEEVEQGLLRLNHEKPIYSGLFLGHLEGKQLKEAVQTSYKKGAKGIAIFAYSDWEEDYKIKLKSALLRE